jgi:RimJ/RimL family protein N-acetyltransferase
MTALRDLRAGPLTLEPQMRGHAEAMFVVLSDPAVYEHEGEPPASVEALRERYARLESRASPDGTQRWFNWVVRHESGELIGYVQATVLPAGDALIAYVFGSAWWGRGYATRAVEAMNAELVQHFGVRRFWAVFKTRNLRSRRLLERLGFAFAEGVRSPSFGLATDESAMVRLAAPA